MYECGRRRSHWPHVDEVDGLSTVCRGHGIGHRIFFGWPPKLVHLISDLRKLKSAWSRGGL